MRATSQKLVPSFTRVCPPEDWTFVNPRNYNGIWFQKSFLVPPPLHRKVVTNGSTAADLQSNWSMTLTCIADACKDQTVIRAGGLGTHSIPDVPSGSPRPSLRGGRFNWV